MSTFTKDPDAVLDYAWDWTPWLMAGETITEAVVTAPEGLTVTQDATDGSTVTAWLSGGTAGASYRLGCLVTTNQGRTDERSLVIAVQDR